MIDAPWLGDNHDCDALVVFYVAVENIFLGEKNTFFK